MLLQPSEYPRAASFWSNHQEVHAFEEPQANLRAFIAIHSGGPLGIAGGGMRLLPYTSNDEALKDALRLSTTMTAKMILTGVKAGGAKCVLVGDPMRHKTPALFAALGRAINSLEGRFVAGADMNTGPEDLRMLARYTPYVERADPGEDAGSAMTARGVLAAMTTAAGRCLGRSSLGGLTVGVQGLGKVGGELAKLLHNQGARLVLADINEQRTQRMAATLRALTVPAADILKESVDILAPCAMGDVLTAQTIAQLRCRMVVGSANNQLAEPGLAEHLRQRGVVYIPDYVANLGGVLAAAYPRRCSHEADQHELAQRVGQITLEVLDEAEAQGTSPLEAAAMLTTERRAAAQAEQHGLGSSALRSVLGQLWKRPWFARSVLNARAAAVRAPR